MVARHTAARGYAAGPAALLLLAAVSAAGPAMAASRTLASRTSTSLTSAREGAGSSRDAVPPSWRILPIPRYADYGRPDDLVTLGRVAIVRRKGGPYRTVRDASGALSGLSCVTEEDLRGILKHAGVRAVATLGDDLSSYAGYDTLILLGPPSRNTQTRRLFRAMGLSFARWRDPRMPAQAFRQWSDFGREGYLLKVGRLGRQNVAILAGNDFDSARRRFYGAGTFYALQSFRQLLVTENGAPRVKTAEVADSPLVEFRGCLTGFDTSRDLQWRDIAAMAAMKANANIYWYGNGLGDYSVQAASHFRYPWTPSQLALYGKYGRCKERFITMDYCMNADCYNSDWAAAKTLDGKTRDPLHYDLRHEVEPGIREMWTKIGYDVHTDVDVLAAKFSQLDRAIGGGAMFQAMNEDDVFGLIHPEDKKLFHADTADEKVNTINYGMARGCLLAALYRRIRQLCPDSADIMPMDPPGSVCYQTPLERNEKYSREFMHSLGSTFRKEGLQRQIPILTTAGGTFAEIVSDAEIDRFKSWSEGSPVQLLENNFVLGRVGAYEIDRKGRRWPGQISRAYPAGYRSPHLYQRLWGIAWNGMGDFTRVLGWCQAQYMWNMLAADKRTVDRLATRKVCTASTYPLVNAYYSLFRRPTAYHPDNDLAPLVAVSDSLAFPTKGWAYVIGYTGAARLAAQRLRARLAVLLPALEARWDSPFEKAASLNYPGYDAANFCSVYLARGYILGWTEEPDARDLLSGGALRDLYLEAEDVQQRYFAGPDPVLSRSTTGYYYSVLNKLYVGRANQTAATPADSPYYVDIWKRGLLGRFFEPVKTVSPPDLSDADASLGVGWGGVERSADGESDRPVDVGAALRLDIPAEGRLLLRVRMGTDASDLTQGTRVTLSVPGCAHECAVCKARWLTWLLPTGVGVPELTIHADKRVRVYAVEVYREAKAATARQTTSIQTAEQR